jgi:hypothetical protein
MGYNKIYAEILNGFAQRDSYRYLIILNKVSLVKKIILVSGPGPGRDWNLIFL